jgi:hypothetical protein
VIEKLGTLDAVRHRAFSATMSHLAAAGRRIRRRRDQRGKKGKSLLRLLLPGQSAAQVSLPDPVKLAVLAIDRVAGASMRASCTGTAVEVSAPDEATASVLRAALAQTARNRATDRLIRVTVG